MKINNKMFKYIILAHFPNDKPVKIENLIIYYITTKKPLQNNKF